MSNLRLLEPIVPSDEAVLLIARREKAWRKSRGITQVELASRSQVSIGSIRRFEQTGQISLESFVRICQALGRDADLDRLFEKPPYRTTADVIKARKEAGDARRQTTRS